MKRALVVALMLGAAACAMPDSVPENSPLRGVTYRVRVLDGAKPAANAAVTFEQLGHDGGRRRETALTDAEGRASWTTLLHERGVRAIARAPERARAVTEWQGEANEPRELTLGEETLVHGKVVNDQGVPQARCAIWVDGVDLAATDDEGAFTLRGFARGERVVCSTLYGEHDLVVGEGDVVITAPSLPMIAISAKGERETADATAWSCLLEEEVRGRWLPASVKRRVLKTAVVFLDVKPATYRVTVRVPGHGLQRWCPVKVLLQPRPIVFELEIGPGRVVFGTVVDQEGAPVAGALVRLAAEDPESSGAKTDATGAFTIRDMPEDASIHVSAPGFEGRWVPVAAGDESVGAVILLRTKSE